MSTDLIECPVCSISYAKDVIERHVENCLLRKKEKPVTRSLKVPTERGKNFFQKRNEKRKSLEQKCSQQEHGDNKKVKLDVIGDKSSDENKDYNVGNDLVTGNTEIVDDNVVDVASHKPLSAITDFQKGLLECVIQNNKRANDHRPMLDIIDHTVITKTKSVAENLDVKLFSKKKLVLGKLPLAEQMRPESFDEYYGQDAVGAQKLLKELFYNDRIPSMILWGPPGCGKVIINLLLKTVQCYLDNFKIYSYRIYRQV